MKEGDGRRGQGLDWGAECAVGKKLSVNHDFKGVSVFESERQRRGGVRGRLHFSTSSSKNNSVSN